MKKKFLFIQHMPPPVHGAAIMGKHIHDSELINTSFDCWYINPTMAKDVDDLAKITLKKILALPKLLSNIRKLIKINSPDICYFTPASGRKGFYKSFIIVCWLKILNQKIVLHFHNKGISRRKDEFIDCFLFKSFFKKTKLIILSKYLYPEFQDYINWNNVAVCPNGIPSTRNKNKSIPQNRASFSILFLSNMIPEKGIWLLLDACKILKEKGYTFRCDFVGKWTMISETEFQQKVDSYHLSEFVKGHGAKYGQEKQIFFENADLFVFPTFYENETFGLVLLEAMEYGIPCISTNEGGISDVIKDGETGLLIEKNNISDLVKKIEIFLNNNDLCARMGANGEKRFNELFTIEKFEKRMVAVLKSFIEEA